jgi:hypothetical protein
MAKGKDKKTVSPQVEDLDTRAQGDQVDLNIELQGTEGGQDKSDGGQAQPEHHVSFSRSRFSNDGHDARIAECK